MAKFITVRAIQKASFTVKLEIGDGISEEDVSILKDLYGAYAKGLHTSEGAKELFKYITTYLLEHGDSKKPHFEDITVEETED